MAVAHSQTEELLKVLMKHLSQETILELLRDLRFTQAYKKNSSFRQTIDRLRALTNS